MWSVGQQIELKFQKKKEEKMKKMNWSITPRGSILRFFRHVSRKISSGTMILSFIISVSIRNKNTYVSRILIAVFSLKIIQVVSQPRCDHSSVSFFMHIIPPPPNYKIYSHFTYCGQHTNSKQWLRSVEISRISVLISRKWGHILVLWWKLALKADSRIIGKSWKRSIKLPYSIIHLLSEFCIFESYVLLFLLFTVTVKITTFAWRWNVGSS